MTVTKEALLENINEVVEQIKEAEKSGSDVTPLKNQLKLLTSKLEESNSDTKQLLKG